MESPISRLTDWFRYASGTTQAAVGVSALVVIAGATWVLWPSRPTEEQQIAAVRRHLQQQDFVVATIEARNVLAANPSSGRARLVFAQALLGSGDLSGAQEELNRAASMGLPPQELMPARADLLLAQGNPQAVIEQFKTATLGDDSSVAEMAVKVAQALIQVGEPEDAKSTVDAALARSPGHVPAQLLRARLLASQSGSQAALERVSGLVEQHPREAAAWLLQGELLASLPNRLMESTQSLRKAVELQPRLGDAHGSLIIALLQLGDLPGASAAAAAMAKQIPGSSQTIYLQALVAHLRGDHAQARERLQLLAFDDNARLLALAGTVELRLANFVQAEALLSKSLQLKPDESRPRRELARLYVLRGQPERALATLGKLIAPDSKDGEAWRIAGQAHTRTGDFARADVAFKQVRRLQPQDKSVAVETGRMLMASGQIDAALRELESAAGSDGTGVAAELELVSAHMVRRDHPAALSAADAIARKQPDSAIADVLRGQILLDSGKRAEARAAFERAAKKEPSLFATAQNLAELDLADGKPEDAKRRFLALLELDPRSSKSMLSLAGLARRTVSPAQEAAEWIDKAVRVNPLDVQTWRAAIGYYREAGDTAGALARARAALAAVPDSPDLLALLADAQIAEGDTLQAIGHLNRLLDLRPGSADVHLMLAQAQLGAKQPERALQSAERALALEPGSTTALRLVLKSALVAQRRGRAVELVKQLQTTKPAQALGWQMEGELGMAEGRFEAAAAAFRKAHGKSATSESAWALYAALVAAGKPAEARQHADTWLQQQAADVTFLNRLGEAAQNQGNLAEAEARFRQALKVQPDSPMLLNNLAFLLVQKRDPAALDLALAASKAAPYSPPILDTLAQAYAARSDLKNALQWQSMSVAMSPRNPVYRINLVKLHLLAGEKKEAREELERMQSQWGAAPLPAEVAKLTQQARD